jgi:ATP synthase
MYYTARMNVRGAGRLSAEPDPKRPVDTVCAESLASDNGSCLAAMPRAEKNIEAISADLSRTFYRLRQSSIDEKFLNVIAGFNALSTKTRLPRCEPND